MNKPRILTAGVAALLAFPSFVGAVDRNWTGGGAPGVWTDPANWDTGVPTTDTGDNIFLHLPGTLTGPTINAGTLYVSVGTPGDELSGFTFSSGTYNLTTIRVGEAHDGLNPTSNRFGRAFINAGTTINVADQFFLGEWDGGTGRVIQSGGDVNVGGQFRVGHWPQADVGGGTDSIYTLNGGTFTVAGDPADPFAEGQAGNVFLGIDSTGILIVNNGVFTSKGITLDNRAATGGEDTLEINGGVVNLGANGIVSQNAGNPGTYEVRLRGGTLRATASWTSNLETTLASGGTGIVYDTNGNVITLSGAVRGPGGLTKSGVGTLILTGDNNYSGGTTITAGTVNVGSGGNSGSLGVGPVVINGGTSLDFNRTDSLTVPGAVSGTGSVNVNSGALRLANVSGSLTVTVANGATFGAGGTVGTVTAGNAAVLEAGVAGTGDFTTSTLTINDGTLRVSVGTGTTKFVVTNPGGFVPNGATTISLNAIGLGVGTFPIIDYTGTIGGAGFAGLTLVGLPSRAIGGLVHNTTGTSVDLNVTAIDRPKWTGAIDGNWDTTTQNWQLVTLGGPATYINLDEVLFDDTASGTTTINLATSVTPTAVTFNNPAKTYTLSGAGGIGGATGLTKQGAGRTILATANTYTGSTNVEAGILQIGDGSTGSLSGTTVTIGTGAAVELNVAGAYATPTTGPGTLRTIGVNNFDLAAGILSGNGLLNIAGAATQVISVANQAIYDGDITITAGMLRATGPQALGTTVKPTVIMDGGGLDVNDQDLGAEHVVVIGNGPGGNGAIVNNGGGTVFNLHRVTLAGPASFGGTGRWDIRDGGIPGQLLDLSDFKLTKVGANQVSLVNIDITPGDIDINSGTFSIEANSNVGPGGTITLNPGGTLGLWVNNAGRLTRNIVANGGSITELGSAGTTTVDSPLSLQANLDFNVNNAATVFNYVGNITEAGGPRTVNVNGPGRLVLLGNNSWTGGFNVNSGTLQVGNGGTAGTLGSGPGTVNGTLVLGRSDGIALTSSINAGGPAGNMILVGGGVVTLANGVDLKLNDLNFGVNGQNDTVGGTLRIADGNNILVQNTLVMGNSAGAGGPNVGVIEQTGGTLQVNAPDTDGRNFVLGHWPQGQGTYNQSGGTLISPNISMAISWDGSGTYNLSNGLASVRGLRFGHSAGQAGVFNLTGGTLELGDQGIWEQNPAFPNDINFGGGTIVAATNTEIRLPAELTGVNGNVVFNTSGLALTVSGALSGAGGYVKTGLGTMTVTSPNIYTGGTIVDGGTLLVNNPLGSGTGSGNVDVAPGSTLGGNGFIGQGGSVVVTVDGKLAPGSTVGTLTMNLGTGILNVTGAVAGPATAALEFDLGVTSDLVQLTSGALTIGAGTLEFDDFLFTISGVLAQGDYVLFDTTLPIVGTLGLNTTGSLAGGLTGTLQFADGTNDLILHVVPEPTTTSALLGGLGMLLAGRRRRRNAAQP
jgi:fibronectin-binding autotransporter adhesin